MTERYTEYNPENKTAFFRNSWENALKGFKDVLNFPELHLASDHETIVFVRNEKNIFNVYDGMVTVFRNIELDDALQYVYDKCIEDEVRCLICYKKYTPKWPAPYEF